LKLLNLFEHLITTDLDIIDNDLNNKKLARKLKFGCKI